MPYLYSFFFSFPNLVAVFLLWFVLLRLLIVFQSDYKSAEVADKLKVAVLGVKSVTGALLKAKGVNEEKSARSKMGDRVQQLISAVQLLKGLQ